MKIHLAAFTLVFLATGLTEAPAADYSGPIRHHRHYGGDGRAAVGECVRTRVEAIGTASGGASAPVIRYRDGVIQDFDGGMLGQAETRPGDPMQLCLVSFTRDCGTVFENELPGRTYAAGNLRTGAAWTLPDIRSSCAAR